jgi:phasin family protein
MFKSVEEFQAFSKEGFEAYVAAATAMTKGLQNIATESADYTRKSFEKGTQTVEKVMAAKSVEKALELQQGYVKDAYESFLTQVTKFNELYAHTLKEAYRPFEAQVAQVTGKTSSK